MNDAVFKLSFFNWYTHCASQNRVFAVRKLVSYFKICIIVTILAIEFGHHEPFHVKLEGEQSNLQCHIF